MGKSADIDEVHKQGLIHASSRVYVVDLDTMEVFLQLRAEESFQNPLYWDAPSGGHIDEGESAAQAAIRECGEELGIDPGELIFLFSYSQFETLSQDEMHEGFQGVYIDNSFHFVYVCFKRGLNISHGEEVAKIARVSLDTLTETLDLGELQGRLIVRHPVEYAQIQSAIQSALSDRT